MGCARSKVAPLGCVDAERHRRAKVKTVFSDDDLTVVVNERNGGLYRVNGYSVFQEIGRGASSAVHLAVKDDRCYAVKAISRREVNLKEVTSLQQAEHHEHIVEFFEYLSSPGYNTAYLVCEYLNGGPLCGVTPDGHLIGEKWSTEHTKSIFTQILDTLAFLHRIGIVHRDLKPDNIVFANDTKNSVKLIDFGTVLRLKTEDDISRRTVGTPFFMPPETCSGDRFPSKELDVWSVGVMLYLVTTGKVPFLSGCKTTVEYYEKMDNGSVFDNLDFPPGFDPVLTELIRKILDRDIVNRATLDELRNHPWFTGCDCPVPVQAGRFVHRGNQLPRSPTRKREVSGGGNDVFSILVVDSHFRSLHIFLNMLKTVARDAGCRVAVDSCSDGDEAVDAAKLTKYNLMFLNIHNPQMSGVEAAQRIRKTEKNASTAIVGMSTSCPPPLLQLCLRCGMENFLLKPLNDKVVVDILTWAGLPFKSHTPVADDEIYDAKNCYDAAWKRGSTSSAVGIKMPISPARRMSRG